MNTSCQFGFVSLDMLNTTVSDSGEYVCVVKNDAGNVQSSCRVIVQPRKDMEPDFYSQGQLFVYNFMTQNIDHYLNYRYKTGRNASRTTTATHC